MKTDRQFIDSIYEKETTCKAIKRKRTATALTASLTIALIIGAIAFMPSGKNHTDDSFATESKAAAMESKTDTSKEAEEIILTRPADGEGSDEMVETQITPNVSLTGPSDSTEFYDALKMAEHEKIKFAIALNIDPLSAFTYEGKYLSEIFSMYHACYIFNDDNHKAYNKYATGYADWINGGMVDTRMALREKAAAGDEEAKAALELFVREENAIFYESAYRELMWKKNSSAEEKAAYEAQKAEYDTIWAAYKDEGETKLQIAYEEEFKRLIAEGYDLRCFSYDGNTVLQGLLTAEQILYFQENGLFKYRMEWLTPSQFVVGGESVDLYCVAPSDTFSPTYAPEESEKLQFNIEG